MIKCLVVCGRCDACIPGSVPDYRSIVYSRGYYGCKEASNQMEPVHLTKSNDEEKIFDQIK
jgi:hypothetical protein